MNQESTRMPMIKLVGLKARTNNKNEMNPATAKIGPLFKRFFSEQLAEQIPHRQNPGVMIAAYTDYASDEHGDYTYFIGEEVSDFEGVPENMATLSIPAQQYCKFTTPAGKMPEVVIHAWQQIWQMTPSQFGGQRAYQADFERYDHRAYDPTQAVMDIYIGIQ